MPPSTYRVRIVRSGFEFEAEGDKAFVLDMVARYSAEAPARTSGASAKPDEPKASVPSATKGLSVREFLQRLGIKKHTDLTLAFGYYLEKYQGAESFTPADVNACYYEAKLEASNTSQMLIQNIKRGFVMEPKGSEKTRKRYTLTASGEAFIEKALNGVE